MELWIRSQDRLRLARIDSVIINARNKKEIISNYSYTLDGFERDIPLGEYNTEERTLEVLEEIQDLLLGHNKMEHIGKSEISIHNDKILYEMPKENK